MDPALPENFWPSTDKTPLYYRCYPGKKTDYYFSIIHGFAEHSGRYGELIEKLQGTGRGVLVHDLRGHGRSGGARGSLEDWEQYWADFKALRAYVEQQGGMPVSRTVVVGHSLGGLIALEGTLRDPQGIAGLILSSPCLGLPIPPALVLLNRAVAHFLPEFQYTRPVNPEDLSRDAAACRAYANDPLIFKSLRAKTLLEMLQAAASIKRSPLQLDIPVWFLAAGNERVVDLKSTLAVYAKLDAPFKKLKVFEAFRHEIFNEVDRQIAYDSVLQAVEQISEFNSRSGKKQL